MWRQVLLKLSGAPQCKDPNFFYFVAPSSIYGFFFMVQDDFLNSIFASLLQTTDEEYEGGKKRIFYSLRALSRSDTWYTCLHPTVRT